MPGVVVFFPDGRQDFRDLCLTPHKETLRQEAGLLFFQFSSAALQ